MRAVIVYASISVTMTWMHRTTVFLEDEPDEIRIVITTVFADKSVLDPLAEPDEIIAREILFIEVCSSNTSFK